VKGVVAGKEDGTGQRRIEIRIVGSDAEAEVGVQSTPCAATTGGEMRTGPMAGTTGMTTGGDTEAEPGAGAEEMARQDSNIDDEAGAGHDNKTKALMQELERGYGQIHDHE
jgi:hypothetical protein